MIFGYPLLCEINFAAFIYTAYEEEPGLRKEVLVGMAWI